MQAVNNEATSEKTDKLHQRNPEALAYYRAQRLRYKKRNLDQWDQEEGLEAHFDPHDYDFIPTEERYFE